MPRQLFKSLSFLSVSLPTHSPLCCLQRVSTPYFLFCPDISLALQSPSVFAAYASASPTPVACAVIAVVGNFAGADDALRCHATSIEVWHEELCTLKSSSTKLETPSETVKSCSFIFFPALHCISVFLLTTDFQGSA